MSIIRNSICTGCGLCAFICKTKAITMEGNENGFVYPSVNPELCVECKKCETACPALSHNVSKPLFGLAMQSKNDNVLMASSSGGAFSWISDYFLNNAGSVFATEYVSRDEIKCVKATTAEERDSMRGSIYVQSRIDHIFNDIELSLKDGITLFVGTPCQVAAVQKLFPATPDNLYTVDLFCHGVMSPKLLADFVNKIDSDSHKKIRKFYFRDKKYGWMAASQSAVFSDGKKLTSFNYAAIKHIYHSEWAMRKSCYDCPFTTPSRVGDISIGDMWNLNSFGISNDNKGFSCVLINTEKGKQLFDEIKNDAKTISIDVAKLTQQALSKNIDGKEKAERFYNEYSSKGFDELLKNHGRLSYREKKSMVLHRICHSLKIDKAILKALGK